ncbi:hypothetical protein [Kitasatospora sp. NPDC098663]|uniref:hypothetical protein n=1 Tax=Kitasatospora sp. NPDC098663 TaxID=3364096 RepID=UPI0038199C79
MTTRRLLGPGVDREHQDVAAVEPRRSGRTAAELAAAAAAALPSPTSPSPAAPTGRRPLATRGAGTVHGMTTAGEHHDGRHFASMIDAMRAVGERLDAGHLEPEGLPPLTPASAAAHRWVDEHLPHLPPRPADEDQGDVGGRG